MKHCDKNQKEPDQVKKACNVNSDAKQQFSLYNITMNITEQKLKKMYIIIKSWRDYIFVCALKKRINFNEF